MSTVGLPWRPTTPERSSARRAEMAATGAALLLSAALAPSWFIEIARQERPTTGSWLNDAVPLLVVALVLCGIQTLILLRQGGALLSGRGLWLPLLLPAMVLAAGAGLSAQALSTLPPHHPESESAIQVLWNLSSASVSARAGAVIGAFMLLPVGALGLIGVARGLLRWDAPAVLAGQTALSLLGGAATVLLWSRHDEQLAVNSWDMARLAPDAATHLVQHLTRQEFEVILPAALGIACWSFVLVALAVGSLLPSRPLVVPLRLRDVLREVVRAGLVVGAAALLLFVPQLRDEPWQQAREARVGFQKGAGIHGLSTGVVQVGAAEILRLRPDAPASKLVEQAAVRRAPSVLLRAEDVHPGLQEALRSIGGPPPLPQFWTLPVPVFPRTPGLLVDQVLMFDRQGLRTRDGRPVDQVVQQTFEARGNAAHVVVAVLGGDVEGLLRAMDRLLVLRSDHAPSAQVWLGQAHDLDIAPCGCWYGPAPGNDPDTYLDARLCLVGAGEVQGTMGWLSRNSGSNTRLVKGTADADQIRLTDRKIRTEQAIAGWRFCKIDDYRLEWTKDRKLRGHYVSKACDDRADLELSPVECPADVGDLGRISLPAEADFSAR